MSEIRSGFTLVETIVALVLSSVVLILVSTTFVVQSQYYSSQTLHTGAHDNARSATERVASEVRTAMDGGVVVAGRRTLTVRSPIVTAVVCDRQGNNVHVHNEGGVLDLDTDEVAGVSWLDTSTGAWDSRSTTWSYIDGGSNNSARRCADNGADTTWAAADFHRIRRLNNLYGAVPEEGEVIMLFRETTFKIQDSQLDPTTLGLFRQVYGESAVEFATGMDTTAHFEFRTGGATYADTITGTSVEDIDAVRLVADARKPPPTGGRDDVTFGWSVNIAVRNVD